MPQKSLGGHRQVSAGQTQDTECIGIEPLGRGGHVGICQGAVSLDTALLPCTCFLWPSNALTSVSPELRAAPPWRVPGT